MFKRQRRRTTERLVKILVCILPLPHRQILATLNPSTLFIHFCKRYIIHIQHLFRSKTSTVGVVSDAGLKPKAVLGKIGSSVSVIANDPPPDQKRYGHISSKESGTAAAFGDVGPYSRDEIEALQREVSRVLQTNADLEDSVAKLTSELLKEQKVFFYCALPTRLVRR